MPRERALSLDVETTGLDASKDSMIELAMLPFEYDVDGSVVGVCRCAGPRKSKKRPEPLVDRQEELNL